MKLVRYGDCGSERAGLLDTSGNLRDLSAHLPDISGSALGPSSLDEVRGIDPDSLPVVEGERRLGPCVGGVGKIVCIGLNYLDHAAEVGKGSPSEPVIFLKSTTSICGPDDPIEIPRASQATDWEVELGVVIGTSAKYVSEGKALDHVAGYCVVNDVSERVFQSERQGQWTKGKSHDTHGPIGPWLVSGDDVADLDNLRLWCEVDGTIRQNGNTRDMIFGVAYLIAYISQFMTLMPGDIIATGTPAGVGKGQKPEPVYLKPGQRLRCGIDGLGEQDHIMVSA